jgi:hypothetical protein
MGKKLLILFFVAAVFSMTGCVKETYNMDKLSKWGHLSPTLAISAARGNISLKDLIDPNDTVRFDENNFITLVFKKDSLFNLGLVDFTYSKGLTDFSNLDPGIDYLKGVPGEMVATFETDTLNLEIKDILSHIQGDYFISNPSIKLNYTNSFVDPIEMKFDVTGKRDSKMIDLRMAPFIFDHPADTIEGEVSSSLVIDKTNSSLDSLISLPPEEIYFSGLAKLNYSGKNGQNGIKAIVRNHILGSIEVEIPLQFRINNLQFSDTLDNFLQNNDSGDSPINPENFEFLRIKIDAENGFPLGISLSMVLFDSANTANICTINAADILEPAPVDLNGIVTEPISCSTIIDITKDFWSSINEADKIIFTFTMKTTDNGTKDVKIYSDYEIDFKAALILKPDIQFNLK